LAAVIRKSPSLKQAEAPRLDFNTEQDAFDYAAEVTQEFDGWLRKSQSNIVEAYKDGRLVLLLSLRLAFPVPPDWHISIRSGMMHLVKHGIEVHDAATPERYFDHGDVYISAQQGLVLLESSQLVECPEGFIPSSVWLKRGHEVEHLFGDVPRSVFSLRVQVDGAVAEREVSVLPCSICSDSDEVTGVVKRVPQVDQSIPGQPTYPVRKRLREPKESEVVGWIKRIVLNNQGVWLTLGEAAAEYIDFIDMRLGVLD
jgi:hypothetical protein